MINPFFLLVGGIIFLIYGGINYYIGLRGWQALFSFVPFLSFQSILDSLWATFYVLFIQ